MRWPALENRAEILEITQLWEDIELGAQTQWPDLGKQVGCLRSTPPRLLSRGKKDAPAERIKPK